MTLIITKILVTIFTLIVFISTTGSFFKDKYQNNKILVSLSIVIALVSAFTTVHFIIDMAKNEIEETFSSVTADQQAQLIGSKEGKTKQDSAIKEKARQEERIAKIEEENIRKKRLSEEKEKKAKQERIAKVEEEKIRKQRLAKEKEKIAKQKLIASQEKKLQDQIALVKNNNKVTGVTHTHSERSHTHPLPVQGINHIHTGSKKSGTPKCRTVVSSVFAPGGGGRIIQRTRMICD